MNTNFKKLNMWNVTDHRGLFMVGTKREEMEHLKNSLFCHPLKRFDRTDKNKNGVIDADELLSRIKKEKAENIGCGAIEVVGIPLWGKPAISFFKQRKPILALICSALSVACGISAFKYFSELPDKNKDIKTLKEYIKLEEAKETSA